MFGKLPCRGKCTIEKTTPLHFSWSFRVCPTHKPHLVEASVCWFNCGVQSARMADAHAGGGGGIVVQESCTMFLRGSERVQ